jgi:transcriptional regulator with XRE-family HTH domain
MPSAELRELIQSLGLTQAAAAKFVGVEPRTLKRWLAGGAPVPHSVILLLRIVDRLRLSPEDMALLLKAEGAEP